jgi:hypothetical protein
LSIVIAYNVYQTFGLDDTFGALPIDVGAGEVLGVSILAFLLAEMFMGRGKPANASR